VGFDIRFDIAVGGGGSGSFVVKPVFRTDGFNDTLIVSLGVEGRLYVVLIFK